MDQNELREAMTWLRAAIVVGERALTCPLSPESRGEWEDAVSRKTQLLRKLEALGKSLNMPDTQLNFILDASFSYTQREAHRASLAFRENVSSEPA